MRWRTRLAVLAVMALIVSACGKDEPKNQVTPTAPTAQPQTTDEWVIPPADTNIFAVSHFDARLVVNESVALIPIDKDHDLFTDPALRPTIDEHDPSNRGLFYAGKQIIKLSEVPAGEEYCAIVTNPVYTKSLWMDSIDDNGRITFWVKPGTYSTNNEGFGARKVGDSYLDYVHFKIWIPYSAKKDETRFGGVEFYCAISGKKQGSLSTVESIQKTLGNKITLQMKKSALKK